MCLRTTVKSLARSLVDCHCLYIRVQTHRTVDAIPRECSKYATFLLHLEQLDSDKSKKLCRNGISLLEKVKSPKTMHIGFNDNAINGKGHVGT